MLITSLVIINLFFGTAKLLFFPVVCLSLIFFPFRYICFSHCAVQMLYFHLACSSYTKCPPPGPFVSDKMGYGAKMSMNL